MRADCAKLKLSQALSKTGRALAGVDWREPEARREGPRISVQPPGLPRTPTFPTDKTQLQSVFSLIERVRTSPTLEVSEIRALRGRNSVKDKQRA